LVSNRGSRRGPCATKIYDEKGMRATRQPLRVKPGFQDRVSPLETVELALLCAPFRVGRQRFTVQQGISNGFSS
jgi:hypothetical protein